MFKQAFVATILAAVCATAIAAEGDAGRSVAYSVQIMHGNELVSKVNLVTRDGVEVPYSSTRERAYVASCTAEGGKAECKTDTVKTGIIMNLRPIVRSDGRIETQVAISEGVVNSIPTFSNNGMTIEMPQVSEVNLRQAVMLTSGKTVELPFGPTLDRADAKTVAITATLAD
ncbi:hypothetical protein [Cupriavidus pinatubonensis]|uniref:Type II/III secretion system secretin-like domain-containing protein n=1 Tax=Cupriavidus pinatubonensis TaxID=248026 RepID=A0ABM8WR45_9BURK|nr:hypothetical protein [Cupriavidus pinatubonensis]CAG9169915.1 hypothetical protein LMG23994_01727 [Cupriavidus pinatubonensis]